MRALASEFDVSSSTIRRDLAELEDVNLVRRVHGGAMATNVALEAPLTQRRSQRSEQKQGIGRVAARLVSPGMAVSLSGGTTTTEVARQLIPDQLTVTTNAMNIANELSLRSDIELIVTGGLLRAKSLELIGPLAEATIDACNYDVAFVGADGVSNETGITIHDVTEASTNRSMLARSGVKVCVADSSKLGATAFARICHLSFIDVLVTDSEAQESVLATIEDSGVRVLVAD